MADLLPISERLYDLSILLVFRFDDTYEHDVLLNHHIPVEEAGVVAAFSSPKSILTYKKTQRECFRIGFFDSLRTSTLWWKRSHSVTASLLFLRQPHTSHEVLVEYQQDDKGRNGDDEGTSHHHAPVLHSLCASAREDL